VTEAHLALFRVPLRHDEDEYGLTNEMTQGKMVLHRGLSVGLRTGYGADASREHR
jgi:hypothetical protein